MVYLVYFKDVSVNVNNSSRCYHLMIFCKTVSTATQTEERIQFGGELYF